MKVILKSFLILVIFSSMTSCFVVIDEINLKKDGSGEFLFTVNMSKSKTKLESIMLLESFRDHEIPSKEDVEKYIDDLALFLQNSEGLSNVKRTIDFEKFIFTIGFDFKSVDNINKAIEALTLKNTNRPKSFNLRYSYDVLTKQYSRNFIPNAVDQANFEKLGAEDKNMFNEAIYISISRFDYMISTCSNKKAKISKSGNAVMIRSSATNLLREKNNISNTIQLK